MARKRRPSANTSLKPGQIMILLVVFGLAYLYTQGYFDRWLADLGLAAKPTAVSVPPGGGSGAPAVALDKAYTASGAWYQVYFTRPSYPERASGRSGGVDTAIAADLDTAKKSIKIAVFEFDSQALTEALLRAKQRGVTVQMVTDSHNLEDPEGAEEIGRLQAAGIPVTVDERSAFMHNKIVIIDDTVLWAGSMNLKYSEIYRNNNNMLRTSVEPLVANYVQRFSDLFAGKLGGLAEDNSPNHEIDLSNGVKIENYFSPSDGARAYLLGYLKNAKRSVRMLAFSFTDDATADQLVALHQAGVDVQIVMEARSEDGTGSEFNVVKEAGISILPDGNCYIQHNKVMIIDEQVVVTGSYNFTGNAENSNDENMLIITDPALARHYLDDFARIQEQARNPTRCGG